MTCLIPVLLAGGEGTRLWPLTEHHLPKPLLSLPGTTASLLQQALERALWLAPAGQVMTVASKRHAAATHSALIHTNAEAGNHLVAEPLSRNTAAASVQAALYALSQWENPVLVLMPVDHAISGETEFTAAMESAHVLASRGAIVTLGIPPRSPDSSYGYILHEHSPMGGAYRVSQFCEKPEPELACAMMEQGNCFWNSGIFVLRADVLLEEMAAQQPQLLDDCLHAFRAQRREQGIVHLALAPYETMQSLPLDRAVMEHSDRLRVIPAEFGWADVGTWERLWNAASKDAQGNAISSAVRLEDCENSYIYTGGKPAICIGLSDLVVVETDHALLIMRKAAVEAPEPPEAGQYINEENSAG